MEHRLDAMLDAQDRAGTQAAVAYGWDKAEAAQAFLNSAGAVILANEYDDIGICNRPATAAEADGVRLYWRMNFITR